MNFTLDKVTQEIAKLYARKDTHDDTLGAVIEHLVNISERSKPDYVAKVRSLIEQDVPGFRCGFISARAMAKQGIPKYAMLEAATTLGYESPMVLQNYNGALRDSEGSFKLYVSRESYALDSPVIDAMPVLRNHFEFAQQWGFVLPYSMEIEKHIRDKEPPQIIDQLSRDQIGYIRPELVEAYWLRCRALLGLK